MSRPWSEVKSRRGAPKRIDTEGFACPNRQCSSFGKTDARVHALVGDGKHGRAERIQTFRCQACRATFSARRDTPLYRSKPPARALSPWCSPRWLKGWTHLRPRGSQGFRHATIMRWLTRAGEHAQTLHKRTHLDISTSSWTNCEHGSAALNRCSGCGWRLILARKFCRFSSSVPALNTWPIASSIPCDSSWLQAAFRSSPVMA